MPPPVQHKIQDVGSACSNTNRGLKKTKKETVNQLIITLHGNSDVF